MNPRMPFDESLPDHTEVSFVPMDAVEEESGRLDASQIRTLGSVQRGYTHFKENDVIFAKITPCMENGKIALATGLKNGLAYGSTEFLVFRPYEGLLPRFLLYFLLQPSLREEAERQMSGGVGHKRVPSNYLFTHEFLLPPTLEQERIVAKLDAALLGLERAETVARRAQERLQDYRAAVLHSAVIGELTRAWRESKMKNENANIETGKALLQRLLAARRAHWEEVELQRLRVADKQPKDDKWKSRYPEPASLRTEDFQKLPQDWCWATLDQIAQEGRPIIYGIIKPGPHDPNGVPYVRVTEMRDEKIDIANLRRVSPDRAAKFARATLQAGDILISKDGTIGRVAVVPPELAGGNITQHVVRVSIHEMISREYVVCAVRSDVCQHWLTGETRGIALQGVNVEDFRHLPIPIPPYSEQSEISIEVEHRLSAANRLAAALEQQLARTRETRHSLLHEAFAGRVVPQDPNDVHASVLLERIRAAREAEAQKPKVKRMRKSKSTVTRRPLLDVLQEQKNPITPEQLFSQAGFKPAQVDLFYQELASLRDRLQVEKPKPSEEKTWPDRAHVLLQLKEN